MVYESSNTCRICDVQTHYLVDGVCYEQTLANCDNLEGAFTCMNCAINYYPDAIGRCTNVGITNIANCAVYATATTCKCCTPDYVVDPNGQCVSRGIKTTGCLSYSDSVTCLYCSPGLYYDANTNSCAAISSSIANCQIQNSDTTCLLCDAGYLITGDSKLCLNNCLVTSQTGCTQCASNYYFDTTTNQCKPVTNLLSNCQLYSAANICVQCAQPFALTGTGCQAFTLANVPCDAVTEPSCLVCKLGMYFDAATKLCTAVATAIENCDYYNPDQTCARCKPTFYFDPFSKTCKAMPTTTACTCLAGTAYRWVSTA